MRERLLVHLVRSGPNEAFLASLAQGVAVLAAADLREVMRTAGAICRAHSGGNYPPVAAVLGRIEVAD